MNDDPTLNIDYYIKKNDKIKSTDISMKWDHSKKPSVFEVRNKDEVVFSGPFQDAMEWVGKNVTECNQNIVKKKSLRQIQDYEQFFVVSGSVQCLGNYMNRNDIMNTIIGHI